MVARSFPGLAARLFLFAAAKLFTTKYLCYGKADTGNPQAPRGRDHPAAGDSQSVLIPPSSATGRMKGRLGAVEAVTGEMGQEEQHEGPSSPGAKAFLCASSSSFFFHGVAQKCHVSACGEQSAHLAAAAAL